MKVLTHSKYFYFIPLVVLTVVWTLEFGTYPLSGDDDWYIHGAASFIADPSWVTFWSSLCDSVHYRVTEDNGRVVNMFGTLYILVWSWLRAVFLGISGGAMVYYAARLAGVWRRSALGYGVLLACVVFVLPWYGSMYMSMFALNYVFPGAVAMWAMCLLWKNPQVSWFKAFAVSFLVCWLHECYGVMIFGGLVALAVMDRRYRNGSTVAWAAGFFVAFLWLFLCSVLAAKSTSADWGALYRIKDKFAQYAPFYLFCAACIPAFLVLRKNKDFSLPFMAMLLGASVAGYVLTRPFNWSARTVWGLLLVVSVGFAYLVSFVKLKQQWSRVLAMFLMLASVVHPIAVYPLFLRARSEMAVAHRAVNDNMGTRGIFVPMTTPATAPWWALGRPNFEMYIYRNYPAAYVVPEQLRDFAPEKARSLGDGAYWYKGCIVMDDGLADASVFVYLTFRHSATGVPAATSVFTTPAGRFVYLYPLNTAFYFAFDELQKVDLILAEPTDELELLSNQTSYHD